MDSPNKYKNTKKNSPAPAINTQKEKKKAKREKKMQKHKKTKTCKKSNKIKTRAKSAPNFG